MTAKEQLVRMFPGGYGRDQRVRTLVNLATLEAYEEGYRDSHHRDAGDLEHNHFDRFTPRESEHLLSDEGLAEAHAKYTEALVDVFVHDDAKIVLELIEELQRLRSALRFEARA